MATTTQADDGVRARLARRGERKTDEGALQKIRDQIAKVRELDAEIADLTARLAEKQTERNKITRSELPDLMKEHKVNSITLAAAGNLPEYEATLGTEYFASLPARDQEKAQAGIKFLIDVWKVPDIVKNAVSLNFGAGKDENKKAKKLFALLKKGKFDYSNKVSVNAQTLTAELRRRVKAGNIPSPADLAKIGGYVQEVVNTEPVKKD